MPRKSPPSSEPGSAPEPVQRSRSPDRRALRTRAADHVFESLSRAILSGELAPGTVLTTQRTLSKQFGVSPLVVRQATHRLEDLGLVSVRQGSVTTVLDPTQATDVRLMQLRLELATPNDRLAIAARESQALSVLAILALVERRITLGELEALDRLLDQMPDSTDNEQILPFRLQFWTQLVRATRNPVLEHQVAWWASVIRNLERNNIDPASTSSRPPRDLYRSLLRAIRRGRGAPELWLKSIRPLLDWAESQATHAMHANRPAPPSPVRRAR